MNLERRAVAQAATWRWRVPRPPPADPLSAFSLQEIETCVRHAKPRQRWGLVAFAADLPLLAALALTAAGRRVVARAAGLATQRLRGFLGDWLKSRGIGLALTVLAEARPGPPQPPAGPAAG